MSEILADLQSDDPEKIGQALRHYQPAGDMEVIEMLENLLNDTRLCVWGFSIETYRCEIRFLAGQALALEYGMFNDDTPVFIRDSFFPANRVSTAKRQDIVFHPRVMRARWLRRSGNG